jgi:hypothetical protein
VPRANLPYSNPKNLRHQRSWRVSGFYVLLKITWRTACQGKNRSVTCVEDSTRRTHPSIPTPKSLPVWVVSCWIPTIVSCTIFPTQSGGTALFSVTSHLLTLASTTPPTLKRPTRRLLLTPTRRTPATSCACVAGVETPLPLGVTYRRSRLRRLAAILAALVPFLSGALVRGCVG